MEARHQQGSQRINLRVRTDTHGLIKRLSVHHETTVAGFVQALLEDMHPHLVQLLGTFDAADHVKTADEGVNVLDQLRGLAVNARAEADRLDALVDALQDQVRREVEAGSVAERS